jgi:hypothetical protein
MLMADIQRAREQVARRGEGDCSHSQGASSGAIRRVYTRGVACCRPTSACRPAGTLGLDTTSYDSLFSMYIIVY